MNIRQEADDILDSFKLGTMNLKQATDAMRALFASCKHDHTSVAKLNGEWISSCVDCGKKYIDSVGEWE